MEVQPSQSDMVDTIGLLGLGDEAQPPSFTFSTAPPGWDINWQHKFDSAPFPPTPSYNSNRSYDSQSVYSGGLDPVDDFDLMAPNQGYTYEAVRDEDYNPNHFSGPTAATTLDLFEDHYQQAAGSVPFGFAEYGRPYSDYSPGSSPGEIERSRSRASSVSSYHTRPQSPHLPVSDSFAGIRLEDNSHPSSPFVTPNDIIISVSPDAPSPPPSSTTSPATPSTSKALGQPLIIPPSTMSGEDVDMTPNNLKTAQPAAPQAFLYPPNSHPALNNFYARGALNADGGPAIQLTPSTPDTIAGGNAARNSSNGGVSGPERPGDNNWGTWPQPSDPQNVSGQYQAPFRTPEVPSWNQQAGALQSYAEQPEPFLSAPSQRQRSASHSMSARPQWQEETYQQTVFSFPGGPQQSSFQPGQGTVNPNQIQSSPFGSRLDYLQPIDPEPSNFQDNSFDGYRPPMNHSAASSPGFNHTSPSLFVDGASLSLSGPGIRRSATTGSTSYARGHRRGSKSEDVGRNRLHRTLSDDSATDAFVRSITSPNGSLIPPDPRSPPPGSSSMSPGSGHRRRGSSGSIGGGSDRGSPYSRPPGSVSPQRSNVSLPGGIGKVERQNVTTPATEQASASRRKNRAPFKCPVEGCGSTFTRQFNLKGHLRSHREERPYVCSWPKCGKGFARQHDCKRHQALHLNIRPFTCDGCGKTFARMDALNRHHKTEGGLECRRPEADSEASSSSNGQGGRRGGVISNYLGNGWGPGGPSGGNAYVA